MTSLFVCILRGTSPFFSSVSCHLPFGNHAKTNIFPHNILITFAADVQRSALHIAFQARRSLSCFGWYANKIFNWFEEHFDSFRDIVDIVVNLLQ